MKIQLIFLSMIYFIFSCGSLNYEHVAYEKNENTDIASGSSELDCAIGALGYTYLIKPIVEKRCMKCHMADGAASSTFQFLVDDSANRLLFKSLQNGNVDSLIAKASNQVSHGGGNQLEPGEQEKIRDFFKMETLCN